MLRAAVFLYITGVTQHSPQTFLFCHDGWSPQGIWGSGEKGYLLSGSWGAMVIIFRDMGSKLIVLGIQGALQKSKKKNISS